MSKRSKRIFNEGMGLAQFMPKSNIIPGITCDNFPQEFFAIIGLFAEDSNFNLRKIYIERNRLFIEGDNYNRTKKNELLLRFGNGQLTVARIEFIHQRQGNMTRLYKILKMIQRKYGLKKIMIESCITDASEGWAKKNGFIECGSKSYVEP